MAGVFTPKELSALAPPTKLLPSEWAEQHRYLPSTVTAEPGRYRGSRTPYVRGIIDAVVEETIEEIVIMKAAQVGGSLLLQNLIGWIVCQEPAPTLLVLPSRDACENIVSEQLTPLIEYTPVLSEHLQSHANAITNNTILFDSMPLYLGYSGSANSLASRAIRFVLLDEVDKFQAYSGKDGDPVSLARTRTATFQHRGRVLITSTPTTPDGNINIAYLACGDRRTYHVPCPHCGGYQQLSFTQVRFDQPDVKIIEDKSKRADYIVATSAAHYECRHCRGIILDKHKPAMLTQGVWLSETQSIDRFRNITGERPKAKRVGFHISALYSPWVSFSKLAAKFVRSIGHLGAMMEFKNQWLGEVFEQLDSSSKMEDLSKSLDTAPEAGIVPKWAGCLIATADVHSARINFVIRAHGRDNRSQLIHFGEVYSFEDLHRMCLEVQYMVDGSTETMTPCTLWVDSGYRTIEVYEFSMTDPRIKALKGKDDLKMSTLLQWTTPDKEVGIQLCHVNTQFFKDLLCYQRKSGKWLINNQINQTYLLHLAGEHKIFDKKTNRSKWVPVSAGAPNHFLDCEVYQLAAASYENTHKLPDEETLEQIRKNNRLAREATEPATSLPTDRSNWLGNTTGWLNR